MGLPDPDDSAAGLRGLLVQPAGLGGGAADVHRTRARLRRPGSEGGCRASDYAAHLVEIARTFRRVPQVAAIAMARSSHLEGRIAAIVDASRARRGPRALLVGLCCFGRAGVRRCRRRAEAGGKLSPIRFRGEALV